MAKRPGMLSLRQDVISVILSRGELSKSEIVGMWGLSDEEYEAVKANLADEKLLEPGPRGKGGFRARFRRRAAAANESDERTQVFENAWENDAVDRLRELLSHKELEGLLGDLVYTVRRARIQMTGEDRRGTKTELATALVIQHQIDLFRHAPIRTLVGRKCRVRPPGRWYPGKGRALQFVHAAGFPAELAGIPTADSPPDFEYLEGRVDLAPLADFQKEVQERVMRLMAAGGERAIVTLPTGAGKTRVAVDSIRDWLTENWHREPTGSGNTVLWLAHTEELCEQAYSCFRQVWEASTLVCPLLLFRFWGRYTRNLAEHRETLENIEFRPTALISTPQRIVNLLKGELAGGGKLIESIERTAGLVLIDEAHRAAAPTYRAILQAFAERAPTARVLGLTATPFRQEYLESDPQAGTAQLKELFRTIIEPVKTLGEDPRKRLQERGFLATPVWRTIKTDTLLKAPEVQDPTSLTEQEVEKVDYALRIRADNPKRRLTILQQVLPIAQKSDTQVLYFGPSVLDAECMTFLLRQQGVQAAFVSGGTRDVTRRKIIADFQRHQIKVLCNCEVLTTGFDAPRVSHIVMARPTVSQVLYEQMLGRGLRGPRFGGTDTCMILDCEDNYRSRRPVLGYQAFRKVWHARSARG